VSSVTRSLRQQAGNNRVGFEFDILHNIVTAQRACDWGAKYESVVGTGTAEIVDDLEIKKTALECIMRQHGSDAKNFLN
jgi:hypothetical protein